jgi:peptidoglycan/xylan/chitin deacetylase (PgdA/CDA1 family)
VHVHLPSNPDNTTAFYSVLRALKILYNLTLSFLFAYPILATSLLSPIFSRHPSELFGWQRTCHAKVAVTFDSGPYIYEKDVVHTLDNAGVKGTFFVNFNN